MLDHLWGAVPATGSATFRILAVCEGNICRSPLAEQMLSSFLAEGGVEALVSSAGLRAVLGSGIDPRAADAARRLGFVVRPHQARQLTRDIAYDADLVLTMTAAQRDAFASRFPRALRHAFTLVEFERLLSADRETHAAGEGLRARVHDLAARRSLIRLTTDDDVVDPYLQPAEMHDRVAGLLHRTAGGIARRLAQR